MIEAIKKISVVSRSLEGERGRGGGTGETQGIFRAIKLFSMILLWWIHDMMHLSKPIGLYNTNGEH